MLIFSLTLVPSFAYYRYVSTAFAVESCIEFLVTVSIGSVEEEIKARERRETEESLRGTNEFEECRLKCLRDL